MKLIDYFEDLNNLTQNPNSTLINFIDQRIPNADYILKMSDNFESKLEIIFKIPRLDFIGSMIQSLQNNKNINNRNIYANILSTCVNNLKIMIKEYISNINQSTNTEYSDSDFKKENLDYAKLILFNVYCIYKVINTIIQNNEDSITEDDQNKYKKIIKIVLDFFEKDITLLKIFESNFGRYFSKFPELVNNVKIHPIISKVSKENKADKEKNNILKNKQVYYFKCLNHENKQYHVIPVSDTTFDSKNETYYDFVIQQGEKDGVWNFLDSPLNNAFVGMKFNKVLFDKLNQEEDKMNILNKIYFINDPNSINILENNNRIKNISISGAKNFKLKFKPNDTKYILPNIKIGVLKVE